MIQANQLVTGLPKRKRHRAAALTLMLAFRNEVAAKRGRISHASARQEFAQDFRLWLSSRLAGEFSFV
jgi:hypothetical protein